MAYSTGTASTPTQLLDALRIFAVANGWTQNAWAIDGAGYKLHISKNGVFANLRALHHEQIDHSYAYMVDGIAIAASTAFDANAEWLMQPGSVWDALNHVGVGGIYNLGVSNTYHLFSSTAPDQIMLVVEASAGTFNHLTFGNLSLYGNYTGGQFMSVSYCNLMQELYSNSNLLANGDVLASLPFSEFAPRANGHIKAVLDNTDGWWGTQTSAQNNPNQAMGIFGQFIDSTYDSMGGALWYSCAPNSLNGITPMLPYKFSLSRTGGLFSDFGYTPHLRYLNIQHFVAGEVITLGTEQWKVFPAYSKNNGSALHGFAVRYEP